MAGVRSQASLAMTVGELGAIVPSRSHFPPSWPLRPDVLLGRVTFCKHWNASLPHCLVRQAKSGRVALGHSHAPLSEHCSWTLSSFCSSRRFVRILFLLGQPVANLEGQYQTLCNHLGKRGRADDISCPTRCSHHSVYAPRAAREQCAMGQVIPLVRNRTFVWTSVTEVMNSGL